jgi:hypothetical protein
VTLNVSVVLRANADSLEGEIGQAQAALKGLGSSARAAGSELSVGLSRSVRAVGETRTAFQALSGSFGVARNGLQQLSFQIQDVAVGLASGQSPFVILSQQGSQAASVLGPGGVVVGAVLAGVGLIGSALFGAGREAEGAGSRIADAIRTADSAIAQSIVTADRLVSSYKGMSEDRASSACWRSAATRSKPQPTSRPWATSSTDFSATLSGRRRLAAGSGAGARRLRWDSCDLRFPTSAPAAICLV